MSDGWSYNLRYEDGRAELPAGRSVLGRSRTCDVSINGPSVSRRHLDVVAGEGRIELQDLSSSNGTYVNDEPVQGEATLADGDCLRLGDVELRVEIHRISPAPARATPPLDDEDEDESSNPPRMIRGRDVATLAPPLAEPPTKALKKLRPPNEDGSADVEPSEAETWREIPPVDPARPQDDNPAESADSSPTADKADSGIASRAARFLRDLLHKD